MRTEKGQRSTLASFISSVCLCLYLQLLQVDALIANEAAIPRFRWGQTKDKLFVTIVVKEIDVSSVAVQFDEARLAFQCLDDFGKTFALDLELAHDVLAHEGKWEPLSRPDRFGRAVLLVMTKVYPFPWEALLSTVPEAYRPLMDRDWTREDQKLEAPEEDAFFKEHETYLPKVTGATLEVGSKGAEVLVLALRHVACAQCKLADDTFAAVAKQLKEEMRTAKGWRRQVRLAVVDVRHGGRSLARQLRGERAAYWESLRGETNSSSGRQGCPILATGCRFYAISPRRLRELYLDGPGAEVEEGRMEPPLPPLTRAAGRRYHAVTIRGRHQAEALLHDLENLVRPQFRTLDDFLKANKSSSNSRNNNKGSKSNDDNNKNDDNNADKDSSGSSSSKTSAGASAAAEQRGGDVASLDEKVALAALAAATAGRALALLPPKPSLIAARAAHAHRLRTDAVVLPAEASLASLARLASPTSPDAAAAAAALVFRPLEAQARAAASSPESLELLPKPRLFAPEGGAGEEADPDPEAAPEVEAEAIRWFATRTLPLLPTLSSLEESEPYEDLPLPVARLFLNGSSSDGWARAAVTSLAEEYLGNVTFLIRNASSKMHEWRQHGLPPRRFPSFGLSLSMRHNATKWGYLDMPTDEAEKEAFWKFEAYTKLKAFMQAVLAGEVAPTKMSEEPPDASQLAAWELSPGSVRKLVGRTCLGLVQGSPTEALVEVYDEWRRDHAWRTLRLDLLSPMLKRWNITVYRLDFSYNECPPGGLPLIPAGYSGYYFVPRMAKERGKTWQKQKKLDPPFEKVLAFLAKHSEVRPKLDATALAEELEAAASRVEMLEKAKRAAAEPSTWRKVVAALVLVLLSSLFLWRRSKRRRTTAPEAAAAAAAAAAEASPPSAPGAPSAAEAAGKPAEVTGDDDSKAATSQPRRRKGGGVGGESLSSEG